MEEAVIRRPQNIHPYPSSSVTNVCPVCHGTGREIYQSSDGTEAIYGEPVMIDYIRKCPKCSGRNINEEDRTEVPTMYRTSDLYQFDFDAYKIDTSGLKQIMFAFVNRFEEWEAEGKGLYIYSKEPGSGKTYLASCLLKSVMLRTQKRCKFITAIDYINKVGESYKRERGELDPSWIYRECELLVLDDIGTQISKEWQQQELFRLINERLNHNLVTIFTSNYKIEQLNIDDRTKNRISKSTIVTHMPEESIRAQKAAEESGKFISRLLRGEQE